MQKGEHYHIDDGYDAMNNIYACGLLEDINIEPEQDMQDPSKINIKIKVDEIEPRSMEVRPGGLCAGTERKFSNKWVLNRHSYMPVLFSMVSKNDDHYPNVLPDGPRLDFSDEERHA
jgi:hypothetical protein